MSGKTLLLMTASYPWGTGELFLDAELPWLQKEFSEIRIFPIRPGHEIVELPDGATCHPPPPTRHLSFSEKISLFRKAPGFILTALFLEWKRLGWRDFLTQFRNNFISLLHAVRLGEFVASHLPEVPGTFIAGYSYWAWDWATVLAYLRSTGKISKAVSRGHGFDIYEQQRAYHPFRPVQLKYLDSFITISDDGKKYLAERFPSYKEKIHTFRLGTPEIGENPFSVGTVFEVVSCSSIHSLKRVEEIATAISTLQFPVHWIHFGGGENLSGLRKMMQSFPPHISAEAPGQVPNSEVLLYYSNKPVHVFLNYSTIEGIPYSIMEAISFGIPVIAPDNGGIREIVGEQSGVLISGEASTEDLANAISEFRHSAKNSPAFRAGVKEFWVKNYSDEKNFGNFVNFLAS